MARKNGIKMYSIHNEEKYVIAERCNRSIKYMTLISKNDYIDKLDDIVKFNNTYRSTIKIKLVDVKSNIYIDSNINVNNKELKFEIGDIGGTSKHKNVLAKS